MSYGFVYLMHNTYMSCFKIGCTERSPHARADELSKPTGVPSPFIVACYVEVRDCHDFEQRMHQWLAQFRVNNQREFFREYAAEMALAIMYHWSGKLALTVVDQDYIRMQLLGKDLKDLRNPWATPKPAQIQVTCIEQAAGLQVNSEGIEQCQTA